MISISPHRIPVKKNRRLALIIHYLLLVFFFPFVIFEWFRKKGSIVSTRVKKILVIRADGIGDVVMSTPFFSQLRELFPNSECTLLAAAASAKLVETMPVFDRLLFTNLPWFFKNSRHKLRKLFRLISDLRKEKFDLAIDLRGDFRNNILMYLIHAKYRVGFDITGCGFLLTHIVDIPVNSHMTAACLAMIRYLNPQDDGKHPLKLWVTNEDRGFARQFMEANHIGPAIPVAILHPGAKWDGRKWAARNYARIGDLLVEQYGFAVIIAGSENDLETAQQISSQMKHRAVIAAGKTSLSHLLALMERSVLFVGVDSGPIHIATAIGIKTIALLGPARREAVGPWGENCVVATQQDTFACSPCPQINCVMPGKSCMDAITVESVWRLIDDYLNDLLPGQTAADSLHENITD